MFSKLITLIALSCFFASCERGSRKVNLEDPCAGKEAKQTTACIKRSQNVDVSKYPDSSGDSGKVDSTSVKNSLQSACTAAKHKDEGLQCKCSNSTTSIRYAPYLTSPNPTIDFKTELSSRCKKDDDKTPLPNSDKPQNPSPGRPPSTPSGDRPNTPVPNGAGTDQTSNAGLAIFVSNTGIPTLVFTKDNATKFSSMDYSSEPLTLAAQATALSMQGQSNVVGALALKISLSFRFESKTCTGSATAKFVEQTSVAVMCN